MPLYEYRCSQCGSCFQIDCEPDERAEQVRCPQCDGTDVAEMTDTFLCEPPTDWGGEPGGGS